MATICNLCGDTGFDNAFVYCVKCLDFAIHRYCLDKLPDSLDEFVYWVCEDCEVKVQKQVSLQACDLVHCDERCYESSKPVEEDCEDYQKAEDVQRLIGGTPKQSQECAKFQSGSSRKEKSKAGNNTTRSRAAAKRKRRLSRSSRRACKTFPQIDMSRKSELVLGNSSLVKKSDSTSLSAEKCKKSLGSEPNKLLDYSNKRPKSAKTSPLSFKLNQKEATHSESMMEEQKCPSQSPKQPHGSYAEPNNCSTVKDISTAISHDKDHVEESIRGAKERSIERHARKDSNEEDSRTRPGHMQDIQSNDDHEAAKPLIHPIWRGRFKICNKEHNEIDEFIAHLSSKACEKVFNEASCLPSLLNLEMLPKSDVWPKSFQTSEPRDDNIALFFFAGDTRCQSIYDKLVEEMVEHELAMRTTSRNAELLVFTSLELPLSFWRFGRKHYLWGVFKGKQASGSRKSDNRPEGIRGEGNSVKDDTWNSRSPVSPLSNCQSLGSGSS